MEVYQRPYDPDYPVICLDEKGKELQSTRAGRAALPAQPGVRGAETLRQDYEYRREGSASVLLMSEPLQGWRKLVVSQQRDARHFARQIQILLEVDYPQAKKVVLVTDNLNIHGVWSFYDTFPPAEAQRLAARVEWHYTPEHGSWLNMAEIELSALERQCLGRRFATESLLRSECEAWARDRNQLKVKIHWQFTAADARIRLHRLYPVTEVIT